MLHLTETAAGRALLKQVRLFGELQRQLDRSFNLPALQAARLAIEQSSISSHVLDPRIQAITRAVNLLDQKVFAKQVDLMSGVATKLVERQLGLYDDIIARLHHMELAPAFEAIQAVNTDFSVHDGVLEALRSIQLPAEMAVAVSSAMAEDVAAEVERITRTPREGHGLASAINKVLSRWVGADEPLKEKLFIILIVLVLEIFKQGISGVFEVEYDRWRNGSEDATRSRYEQEQTEALRRALEQIVDIQDRISHPPIPAVVIRSGHLRAGPDSTTASITRLPRGSYLLVLERRDGWLRVEAEPEPGRIQEGWVYGRLTRYLP